MKRKSAPQSQPSPVRAREGVGGSAISAFGAHGAVNITGNRSGEDAVSTDGGGDQTGPVLLNSSSKIVIYPVPSEVEGAPRSLPVQPPAAGTMEVDAGKTRQAVMR